MAVISIEAVHDRDFFTKPYSGLEDLFRNCTVNDHKFLSTYPLHQELLPYVKQKLTTYDIVGFDGLIDAAIEDRVDALLQDSAFCGVVEPAPLLIATLPDGRRVPFTSHDLWFARRQNDGFQIVRTSEFLIFNICLAVGQACVVAVWKSDKGWLGQWNIDGVVQACVISADGSTLVCAREY